VADYANLMEWVVKKDGPVATIKFDTVEKPLNEFIEHHMSLGLALEKVRFDDEVRVVVITGRDDGMFELGPMRGETEPYPPEVLNPATRPGGPGALRGPWNLSQGIERTFQTLALMEKPVIGRLNGDAYGFALHAMWGCDIVIAQEDIIVSDNHLSLHPVLPYGMSAGDGAFAFLPLFLTPVKLKEFLLLGPTWTGKQLAELGLVNYAANKRLLEQLNLTLDYAWGAESLDLWEGGATGFVNELTLRPDDDPWYVEDPGAEVGLDPQHKR
jgi:enoyl-CoA hydratase/carnithine racemase